MTDDNEKYPAPPASLPNTAPLYKRDKLITEPTAAEVELETAQISVVNENPYAKRYKRIAKKFNYMTVIRKFDNDPEQYIDKVQPYYEYKSYQSFTRELEPWELEIVRQYNEVIQDGFVEVFTPVMVFPFNDVPKQAKLEYVKRESHKSQGENAQGVRKRDEE